MNKSYELGYEGNSPSKKEALKAEKKARIYSGKVMQTSTQVKKSWKNLIGKCHTVDLKIATNNYKEIKETIKDQYIPMKNKIRRCVASLEDKNF